jgi:hypothetical protein
VAQQNLTGQALDANYPLDVSTGNGGTVTLTDAGGALTGCATGYALPSCPRGGRVPMKGRALLRPRSRDRSYARVWEVWNTGEGVRHGAMGGVGDLWKRE